MKDFNTMDDIKMVSILESVKNNLINLFGNRLQNIILYGSYARNDYTNESDMDIFVLVNDEKEILKIYEDKIIDIMVDISLEFDIVLSIYIQTVKEYNEKLDILPFLQNIKKEGIKIYG